MESSFSVIVVSAGIVLLAHGLSNIASLIVFYQALKEDGVLKGNQDGSTRFEIDVAVTEKDDELPHSELVWDNEMEEASQDILGK